MSARRASILGHATSVHDGAIAVLADDFIFAESVARHTQCKFAHGFTGLDYSWRAVRAALEHGGAKLTHDVVVRTTWSERPQDTPVPEQIPPGYARHRYRACLAQEGTRDLMELFYVEELIQNVDAAPRRTVVSHVDKRKIDIKPTPHHLTHAATAVYTSPFEECVVLVADGNGESDWLTWYHFDGQTFHRLEHVEALHSSMGILYGIVTQLCGFSMHDGEEWKVMGLAAYGERDERIYDFFKSRTEVKGLHVGLELYEYDEGWTLELEKITGPFRLPGEPDIVKRSGALAKSFQDYFEDTVMEVIQNAYKLGLSENLAYAGGLALNSSCNGKILERTGFKRLHIPSAPADDGNALGAALYERHHERKEPRRPCVMTPYLGSYVLDIDVERAVAFSGLDHVHAKSQEELCEIVASLLAEEKIVAWCQGRAEFGPRALGHRSILADPRAPNMRDRVNNTIKFREEYRPLAPSVLHEYGPEYFENYQDSPYMERTLRFKPEVKARVPSVVHRDGTGRLQSVHKALSPLYHQLIEAFRQKTGVPMLLNTSFNVMGKPIVHSVADAMSVFCTSGIEALALGRYVILKGKK